jgi:hypothetical protein
MEAAVRPIGDPADMPMLHRIEVNVIDMTRQIGIIANRVLPVTSLPDALLSFSDLALRSWHRFNAA